MISAVILAGGKGTRMGAGFNKIFLRLGFCQAFFILYKIWSCGCMNKKNKLFIIYKLYCNEYYFN